MGFFTSPIKTFEDLYLHTVRDIYYAENRILKSLPTMIEKAHDPQLKQAFQQHLHETEGGAAPEADLRAFRRGAGRRDLPSIDGIIDEAEELISDVDDPNVLDAALLAAAQAVEHYEITRYGTLIAWAKQINRPECVPLLQQTLDEEYATDKKLTQFAEQRINRLAE